jgi:hypothetical protein
MCSYLKTAFAMIGFGLAACTPMFDRYLSERPPCHLLPLTDSQVLSLVREKLGSEDFLPKNLPEPNRRVSQKDCIYFYEQSEIYYNGQPVSLDALDSGFIMMVTRDGRVY